MTTALFPAISFMNMVKALGTYAGTRRRVKQVEDAYDLNKEPKWIYASNFGNAVKTAAIQYSVLFVCLALFFVNNQESLFR